MSEEEKNLLPNGEADLTKVDGFGIPGLPEQHVSTARYAAIPFEPLSLYFQPVILPVK